jgi:hypothetical protein
MQTLTKCLVTTVAALALMGAVADANAFGISISFGGLRFHHVGRHHYGSTRHRSSTRREAMRHTKRDRSKAQAETTKLSPGTHASAKDEVAAIAKAITGEQKAADAAWQTYQDLPKAFRDIIGPVGIYTFANIADFRRIAQIYNAPDGAAGYSSPIQFKDGKDFFCRVNLIGQDDLAAVLAHELGHCADFRYKIGHSMPLMEAFFQDSTKDTKAKLIADGFAYYTTEPQEAFAQAIAHYLMPSIREDYSKWEADWPNLNAHVRKMLDEAKIAYVSPKVIADRSQRHPDYHTLDTGDGTPTKASAKTEPVPVAPLDY